MQGKGAMKLIWGVLSPLVLYYAVTYVVLIFFLEQYQNHPTEIGALAAVLTVPLLYRMFKKDGGFPEKKAPFKKYGLIVGISIALTVALNNILLLLNVAQYSEAYQETAETLYSPSFLMQLLCLGIAYPVLEELMFRGIVYRRMKANSSANKAIFISALFFGLYHGNLVQMIYGTVAGLMLAYVYEKYGSMKAPILAHMSMNLAACVLTQVNGFAWMFENVIRAYVITAVCVAALLGMFQMLRRANCEEG